MDTVISTKINTGDITENSTVGSSRNQSLRRSATELARTVRTTISELHKV